MNLNKHELIELAKRSDHRSLLLSHAAIAGGMLGFATFLLLAVVSASSSCHEFEDVFFHILIPSLVGGLIGASGEWIDAGQEVEVSGGTRDRVQMRAVSSLPKTWHLPEAFALSDHC